MNERFEVIDLGRMAYSEALVKQESILDAVVNKAIPDTLLLVEHPPILTLGANFHTENLLLTEEEYEARGIDLSKTGRGGDVTYHGPGQLVAYPIFSLDPLGRDLHRWLRTMEEAVINVLQHFDVAGERNSVNTGVWVGNKKICAMGIRVRKWVSMHGLALNCNTDLSAFGTIVPCGIRGGYGVTSLSQELARTVSIDEVKPILVESFKKVMPC